MSTKNADMPAMPMDLKAAMRAENGHFDPFAFGLTKREVIAMHAMSGLISGIYSDGSVASRECPAIIARASVQFADALLSELG